MSKRCVLDCYDFARRIVQNTRGQDELWLLPLFPSCAFLHACILLDACVLNLVFTPIPARNPHISHAVGKDIKQ